jgi:hypothetical protein
MSSAVVSTSAASSRLFVFDDAQVGAPAEGPTEPAATAEKMRLLQSTLAHPQSSISQSRIFPASVTPASRLAIRSAPEMASSGIPALDALTGGLPRGCLTEICGPVSSGRTTVSLAALAASTRRGECCVLVDASDALDPRSAADAGVDLHRLLWVRCGEDSPRKNNSPRSHRSPGEKKIIQENASRASEHRLEQVLRATDLLLESGGFGLIVLDLAHIPPQDARRVPLTTWFRFRRAIEHTSTILLAVEQQPIAGSCSSLLLQLGAQVSEQVMHRESSGSSEAVAHARLLTGLQIIAELACSRLERKPARSTTFTTQTAWAG